MIGILASNGNPISTTADVEAMARAHLKDVAAVLITSLTKQRAMLMAERQALTNSMNNMADRLGAVLQQIESVEKDMEAAKRLSGQQDKPPF